MSRHWKPGERVVIRTHKGVYRATIVKDDNGPGLADELVPHKGVYRATIVKDDNELVPLSMVEVKIDGSDVPRFVDGSTIREMSVPERVGEIQLPDGQ